MLNPPKIVGAADELFLRNLVTVGTRGSVWIERQINRLTLPVRWPEIASAKYLEIRGSCRAQVVYNALALERLMYRNNQSTFLGAGSKDDEPFARPLPPTKPD